MHYRLAATILAVSACNSVQAQDLTAVRPLRGYACMQLAITPEQSVDPKVGVPVRDAPSRSASIVSYAASTMIVQEPPQPIGGFLRVLRFTGQEGWIEAHYLRPWVNKFVPTARCVPSIMSNGRPGFGSSE